MNSVFENVFDLNPYQQHLLAVSATNRNAICGIDGRVFDPQILRKLNDMKEHAKAKAKEMADHVRKKFHEAHSGVKELVNKAKKHALEYLAPRWEDALKSVEGLVENISKVGPALDVLDETLKMIRKKEMQIQKTTSMNF
jgi:replicative DNA helicase